MAGWCPRVEDVDLHASSVHPWAWTSLRPVREGLYTRDVLGSFVAGGAAVVRPIVGLIRNTRPHTRKTFRSGLVTSLLDVQCIRLPYGPNQKGS